MELVPGEGPDERDGHNPANVQVAPVCGESRHEDHGLPLEEGAERHEPITV